MNCPFHLKATLCTQSLKPKTLSEFCTLSQHKMSWHYCVCEMCWAYWISHVFCISKKNWIEWRNFKSWILSLVIREWIKSYNVGCNCHWGSESADWLLSGKGKLTGFILLWFINTFSNNSCILLQYQDIVCCELAGTWKWTQSYTWTSPEPTKNPLKRGRSIDDDNGYRTFLELL